MNFHTTTPQLVLFLNVHVQPRLSGCLGTKGLWSDNRDSDNGGELRRILILINSGKTVIWEFESVFSDTERSG